MTGKNWLAAVGLGMALISSGCVTCCHESAKAILEAGPTCDVPHCDRQKAYAVFIDGVNPFGLCLLRDRLAENGFAKVYCGNMAHAGWFKREIVRVHADDPSTRFVIVGYEMGCSDANGIAADVMEAGVPVDAVILVAPVATRSMRSCPARRILVTCGYDVPETPHSERCTVCDANPFTLPTHATTVGLVLNVLKESASRVEHPPVYEFPTLRYEHAAPPVIPSPIPPGAPADWLFLEDYPGPHTVPLSPVPDLLPVPIAPSMVPRTGFPTRWTAPVPPLPSLEPRFVPLPLPEPPSPVLPQPRPLPGSM
jgi:hypothetical protein